MDPLVKTNAHHTYFSRSGDEHGRASQVQAASDDNVITVLHVPMPDAWGKYYRRSRLILLSDAIPADRRRQVVRRLLTGQVPQSDVRPVPPDLEPDRRLHQTK